METILKSILNELQQINLNTDGNAFNFFEILSTLIGSVIGAIIAAIFGVLTANRIEKNKQKAENEIALKLITREIETAINLITSLASMKVRDFFLNILPSNSFAEYKKLLLITLNDSTYNQLEKLYGNLEEFVQMVNNLNEWYSVLVVDPNNSSVDDKFKKELSVYWAKIDLLSNETNKNNFKTILNQIKRLI